MNPKCPLCGCVDCGEFPELMKGDYDKKVIKEFLKMIYLQAIVEEPEDVMEFLEQVETELEVEK